MALSKIRLNDMPGEIAKAQALASDVYHDLLDMNLPRNAAMIAQASSRLRSLVLSGPDSLAKAALNAGIHTYIKMGPALKGYKKLDLLVQLDVLEAVKGFDQTHVEAARSAGQNALVIAAFGGKSVEVP